MNQQEDIQPKEYNLETHCIFQLTQRKLAEMLTELRRRNDQLETRYVMNEGKATTAQISLAKRNNVHVALEIAREARHIHGAMGITASTLYAAHDELESVITYEGTHDIHLLILGNEITGISAFG